MLNIDHLCEKLTSEHAITTANLAYQPLKPQLVKKLAHALCQNKTLERLILSHTKLSTRELLLLQDYLPQGQLLMLDLSHNQLVDLSLEKLAQVMQSEQQLEVLDLSANRLSDHGIPSLVKCLLHMPALVRLRLANNRITDRSCRLLAQTLMKLPDLQELDLSQNQITDQGVVALCEELSGHQSLKRLILSSCRVSDRGMKFLFYLVSQSKLDTIEVANNQITDASLLKLKESNGFQRIKSFNIAKNNLTAIGIECLIDLAKTHYELRRCDIHGNQALQAQLNEMDSLLHRNKELYQQYMRLDSKVSRLDGKSFYHLMQTLAFAEQLPDSTLKHRLVTTLKHKFISYFVTHDDLFGVLLFSSRPFDAASMTAIISLLLHSQHKKIPSMATLILLYCIASDDKLISQEVIRKAFRQLKIDNGCVYVDRFVTLKELTGFKIALPYRVLRKACDEVTSQDADFVEGKCRIHKMNPIELQEFCRHPELALILRRKFSSNHITLIEHLIQFAKYYPIYTTTQLPSFENEVSMGSFKQIEKLQQQYFTLFDTSYQAKIPQLELLLKAISLALQNATQHSIHEQNELEQLLKKSESFAACCVEFINWAWCGYHNSRDENIKSYYQQYCLMALDFDSMTDAMLADSIKLVSSSLCPHAIGDWQLKRILYLDKQNLRQNVIRYCYSKLKIRDETRMLAQCQEISDPKQRFQLLLRFVASDPNSPCNQWCDFSDQFLELE